ncbi:MAG: helix-turn-helix transcriptional regulator [Oscillospiraceae bacterium]|nr:helix-turn-helix transcriptional regulator [Oscillospiraceae bacterium]MBQ7129417.1 helix-turn-helix transcriptional regulator [Oscillospiraceae bacterium]
MSQNKSLSTQEVADILHVSKSTIYDLIRRGEIHSYKIGRKVRFTQDDVDAYIARSRHEHSTRPVKNIDTHSTLLTPEKKEAPELIISGQDVVLDILANYLQQEGVNTARTYLNSFEGLLSLYQDNIQVAACHLFDGFDYNTGYVRSLMPGVPAVLVNVSYRTQGFYVQKGNPKNIKGWSDLGRKDITVLNRRVGSSARILMDIQLKRLGIPASGVRGYDKIMKSHLTMAAAIAAGEADLAIGTERISRQIENLDFIPLLEERFDFVIKKETFETEAVQKLMKVLKMPAFRREIAHFSGNDYRDLGNVIMEV